MIQSSVIGKIPSVESGSTRLGCASKLMDDGAIMDFFGWGEILRGISLPKLVNGILYGK